MSKPNFYERSSYPSRPPRNGDTRVIADKENVPHLEFFMNGSWRHNQDRCREYTNKDCRKK